MSRSALSEQVNRLLPGEKWKRVREAILQSATYSGQRLDTLRRNIDQENRLKDGKLQDGTLEFPDSTTAELDLFVWVINYQIFQPGFTSLPVLAHDPDFPRPDVFTGDGTGTIKYYPGTMDSEGNGQFPDIPEGEVILREVIRNTDGSNDSTPGNGGGGNYVSKSATGNQTIKSDLTIQTLSHNAGGYMPVGRDANGKLVKARMDNLQVYKAVGENNKWNKVCGVTKSVNAQTRLAFRYMATNSADEIIYLEVYGYVNISGGDYSVGSFNFFGEIQNAEIKAVNEASELAIYIRTNRSQNRHWQPLIASASNRVEYYNLPDNLAALPSGDQYDFVKYGDLSDIEASISDLESDLTDLEGNVLAIETQVDDHEDRINTLETQPYLEDVIAGTNVTIDKTNPKQPIINATGGGGTGSGGYTDLVGFPVIPFDKNYRYAHEMAGPVEISVNTTLVRAFPNHTILYIKANGVDKPTFKVSDNFSILMDDWNNTAGEWNRIRLEWSPQLRPVGQIMDTSGATSPGTGSTVITLTFEDNHSSSHVITGTVSLAVDDTDAAFPNRTILYFQADGVNKPMWDDPIECNFDNYINEAGVWNRFYLEWTPENKVTLQISNT